LLSNWTGRSFNGDDGVKTLLQFAETHRVGHIVMGAVGKELSFLRRLKGEISIVDRLIKPSRDVTIMVMNTPKK
jgi:two-component system sensor histidine kinase KdpD